MTFSEYLQNYITENQIKWLTASKMCNVDRQQLKRYTKGCTPKSMDTVEMIADGLGMSEQQKGELCRLYQRQKMGNEKYLSEMFIHQIFCEKTKEDTGMGDTAGLMASSKESWEKEQVLRISELEQFYELLGYLVQDVTEIRMKMNWAGKEDRLAKILLCANKSTNVQQVIEITSGKSEINEMMELEALLPLFHNIENYHVYCHYQWETAGLYGMEGMNFIITDKGVVLFDRTFRHAVYSNKQGYVEYYRELFARGLAKTNIFGGSTREYAGMTMETDVFALENKESKTTFLYQKSPKEVIWVKKTGEEKKQFYVEEMRLVQMFKTYMKNSETICV